MTNLVFIHGRDQQNKVAKDLEKLWVDTLKKGLATNELTLPESTNIIFPYFGDKLDELVKQAGLPHNMEQVIAKGGVDDPQTRFFHDFLTEISINAGITSAMGQASNPSDVQERGVLKWGWVQTILRALDTHTCFGQFTLEKWTYDVYMYLTKPGIRRAIDKFVVDQIGEAPCVVVGHSLGSVIGYNVLSQNPNLSIEAYITIGSPLGLEAIKTQLDKPLAMPKCIERDWFNAFDAHDVVALNPLDKSHFNIHPEITNRSDVNNQTDNKHGIEGYLNNADVAKWIYVRLTK